MAGILSRRPTFCAGRASRSQTVVVKAGAWQKATTKSSLSAAGGRQVVELGGAKVLVVETEGEVYAVNNKCSHLGLPLVGKTAMFQGQVSNKCIVCPAHNTAFDLATGEVKGEWCPKFPQLPLVGKLGDKKPLPTYQSRVDEAGNVEVYV
ncbi:rieske ferredoxin [Scenedesmus sp. NREL 46B-D3]|nr:rieske ferredoxin [Scenedesmus sp. NREL 46B-D3]